MMLASYTTPRMAKKTAKHPIIVWADPQQEGLIREAIDIGKLCVIGVGSDSTTTAAALADAFDCERVADLRQAVHRDEATLLWIAASISLDQTTLKLIHEAQRLVAVNQPQPGAIGRLATVSDALRTVHPIPLMRKSPGYRLAREFLDDFGTVRCVNVSFRSGPGEPALYSRLFDAMDVIASLCGQPEIVDAGLAVPREEKPESLAGLSGHMTVNLRFADDRCACVAISDRAGGWFRGVTVLGDGGCLRISDDGFEWRSAGGDLLDAHEEEEPFSAGALCGMHLLRMIEQRDVGEAPPDIVSLLALCEAARLSSRTGEGEDPRRVISMMSRP
jgi:predicted dehydrogenase